MALIHLHPSARRLHDFASREEGSPGSAARSRVHGHLAACADCRRQVSAIRAVLSEGESLRGSAECPPDAIGRILHARVTGVRVALPVTTVPGPEALPRWLAARERAEGMFDTVSLPTTLLSARGSKGTSAPTMRRLLRVPGVRVTLVIACVVLPALGIAQVVALVNRRSRTVAVAPLVGRGDQRRSVTLSAPGIPAIRAAAADSDTATAPRGRIRPDTIPVISLTVPDQRITGASGGFESPRVGTLPGSVIARENGELVLMDPPNRIVVLDRAGHPLHTAGGTGTGPGQFKNLSGLGELGDTIWARDPTVPTRFALYRSDLSLIGTPFALTPINVLGLLPNGRVFGTVPPGRPGDAQSPTGYVPIAVTKLDGGPPQEIARLPLSAVRGTFTAGLTNIAVPTGLKDGVSWGLAPEGDRLVILEQPSPPDAQPAHYVVTAVRPSGDTLWRRSIPFAPQRAPDSVFNQFRAAVMVLGSKALADSVLPTLPRFYTPVVGMVVGAGGDVWIGERTARPDQTDWLLLDSAGIGRVRIRLDSSHRVVAARGSDLWTVSLDAEGHPSLNRFTIHVPR